MSTTKNTTQPMMMFFEISQRIILVFFSGHCARPRDLSGRKKKNKFNVRYWSIVYNYDVNVT